MFYVYVFDQYRIIDSENQRHEMGKFETEKQARNEVERLEKELDSDDFEVWYE